MAISHKAPFWFLFAGGGTIVAFVLPIMIFMTGLAPALGIFSDAWSYEGMRSFVEGWFVKLVLFGIITLAAWHAAHRLRVVAHDFGIRADSAVAVVVYGLAALATLLCLIALWRI
jgi:fumarate reductase subunit D